MVNMASNIARGCVRSTTSATTTAAKSRKMEAIRVCNHMAPRVIKDKFHAYFQSFQCPTCNTSVRIFLLAMPAFLPCAIVFLPKIRGRGLDPGFSPRSPTPIITPHLLFWTLISLTCHCLFQNKVKFTCIRKG